MAIQKDARIRIKTQVTGQKQLDDLGDKMGRVEERTAGMSAKMALAVTAGNIFAGVATRLAGRMSDVARVALTWDDWVGKVDAGIGNLSESVAGIIGPLELVRAKTQLQNNEFAATDRQLQAVAKAAVVYSRINKTELSQSITQLVEAIRTGRDSGIRRLGIDVELTGNKSQKAAQALKVLEDRFADMKIEAENTNEKIAQMEGGLEKVLGRLGTAVLRSDPVKKFMKDTTGAIERVAGWVERWGDETGDLIREQRELEDIIKKGGTSFFKFGHSAKGAEEQLKRVRQRLDEIASRERMEKWASTVSDYEDRLDDLAKKMASTLGAGRLAGHTAAGGGLLFSAPDAPSSLPIKAKKKRGRGRGKRRPAPGLDDGGFAEAMGHRAAMSEGHTFTPEAEAFEGRAKVIGEVVFQADAATRAVQGLSGAFAEAGITGASMTDHFANLAGGMFSVADAAIQSGQSFGVAMANMVKQQLLAIAKLSAIESIKHLAAGFGMLGIHFGLPNPGSISHFAAAGIYAGIAGAAGGAGLGISSATAKSKAGGGAGAGSSSRRSPATPGGGTSPRRQREQQRPIVNVWVGRPNDPSASFFAQGRSQIAAEFSG